MLSKENILPVVVVVIMLPHIVFVSPVMTAFALIAILWRTLYIYRGMPLPGAAFRTTLTFAGITAAVILHGRPVGIVPATAILLVALSSLLLRETQKKDIILIFAICGMLLICSAIQEQNLINALHLCLSFALMLQFLNLFTSAQVSFKFSFRSLLKKLFILLPVVIVLFLVIPRAGRSFIPPILKNTATSGFSDSLDPGSVARLIQSDNLAFRARFLNSSVPDLSDLYWRGKTLSQNRGMSWSPDNGIRKWQPQFVHSPPLQNTEVILEPRFRDWLFTLDKSVGVSFPDLRWQSRLEKSSDYSYYLKKPASERLLYQVTSTPASKDILSAVRRHHYLEADTEKSAELQQVVNKLSVGSRDERKAEDYAANLGQFFRKEGFTYTLAPGAMQTKRVEDFILDFKKGFCEHYAAASAHMFRLAGIPSRVVVGFHGGSMNPVDGFVSVRGKDAHAWTEYYSDSLQQWQRFDATSFVAPDRLSQGGQSFHQSGMVVFGRQNVPGSIRKLWDGLSHYATYITTSFNLFMLTFDFSYQKEILRRLHISPSLWGLALIAFGLVFGLILAFFYYRRFVESVDTFDAKLYQKTLRRLKSKGMNITDFDSPTAVVKILKSQGEKYRETVTFIDNYISYRYGKGNSADHTTLKELYKKQNL